MTDVLMPALSPTMEEGTLSKWTVKAGDTVKSGDVIAEIETDKATMEVEAVDEGVVEALLVPEGTEGVKVNTPIARLKGEGEGAAAPSAAKGGEQASPPQSSAAPPTTPPQAGEQGKAAPPPASPVNGGGGSANGRDGRGVPAAAKPEDGARAARDASAQDARAANIQGDKAQREPAPAPSAPPAQAAPSGAGSPAGDAPRAFASPLARRLAQAKGIDLASVKGSGPHGRIVRTDIDAAQPGAAPAQPGAAPAPQPALTPAQAGAPPSSAEPPRQAKSLEQMGIAPGSYDLHPLNGMKKTVARRMTESWRDIPHFPLTIDLRLDELLAFRTKLNARLKAQGVKVSVNDVLIKCAALALKAEPEANASYTPDGIAWHHAADVAVAVAVEGGLITPIVRAAETRGLADIARTMKDLAERARDRKLKPEEYQGGTFSISNLGMFGIKSFASIINEPQGMILSVGAGEKRPVVDGDQLAVATVMTCTLTCDHRVVDGAIGARWLAAFKGFVEDPITMMA